MVLIIADDDKNLLDMLVPYLEHAGHKVLLVCDGEELLRKIREVRADLIISDINMPGFDGVKVYRKARGMDEYADAPFILWSGLDVDQGRALAREDRKLRFLKKPFSMAVLQRTIDELTA